MEILSSYPEVDKLAEMVNKVVEATDELPAELKTDVRKQLRHARSGMPSRFYSKLSPAATKALG